MLVSAPVMGCCPTKVSDNSAQQVDTESAGNEEAFQPPREAWMRQESVKPQSGSLGRQMTTVVEWMEIGAQTESDFNADEFDWDLRESADVETQTYRLRHQASSDMSVQTDVRFTRIMLSGSSAGRGSLSPQSLPGARHMNMKTTSTQTVVLREHKVTQTLPLAPTPTSRTVTRTGSPLPLPADPRQSSSSSEAGSQVNMDFENQLSRAVENGDIVEHQPTSWSESEAPPTSASRSLQRPLNPGDDDSLHELFVRPASPKRPISMKDVAVQTVVDMVTDESPEFAALPPSSRKWQLLASRITFRRIDRWVNKTPDTFTDLVSLTDHLMSRCRGDELLKVRAFFMWIVTHIAFDWSLLDASPEPVDVLRERKGVSRDYARLFQEMCECIGVRVKSLRGFAKDQDYRPGHQFRPNESPTHAWNAVFVHGSWRLVDCTWGAGHTDGSGRFVEDVNDFYFLTDPEDLKWTHFPFNEHERNYDRWQLLTTTQTLTDFNSLPKLTPWFCRSGLRLKKLYRSPTVFNRQMEVEMHCNTAVMRFKYKFFQAQEVESDSLNCYVFCFLRGDDRRDVRFTVRPAETGSYYLKVFSRPEQEVMEDESLPLHHVATFLLRCDSCRASVIPWPVCDVPWGPTGFLAEMGARVENQEGPVIVTWGGRHQLVFEAPVELITSTQIFSPEGSEMNSDSVVRRKDSDGDIVLLIHPPRVGFYKLMLYGMPKPRDKGRWRLPLIAAYLVDAKLCTPVPTKKVDPDAPAAPKKIRLKPRAR